MKIIYTDEDGSIIEVNGQDFSITNALASALQSELGEEENEVETEGNE